MKRTLAFVVIAFLIAMGIYFAFFHDASTLSGRDTNFSPGRPDQLGRIVIEDSAKKAILELRGDAWYVYNSYAHQGKVSDAVLLAQSIEVVSPVSNYMRDSIIQCLEQGIHISYYSSFKKLKSYSLCKWNNTLYAIRDRSKKPYRIEVKGYSGVDLTRIFSADTCFWLENLLVSVQPADIRAFSLHYSENDAKDFEIVKNDSGMLILSARGKTIAQETIRSDYLKEYLYNFSNVRFSERLTDTTRILEFKDREPFFTLKIMDRGNQTLLLYGYPKTDAVKNENDPYVFYGLCNRHGFIILKYSDFDPILVAKDYFLKK